MKIVFSLCPAWHRQPPLALGIMTALAKQLPNVSVTVLDLNQLFYTHISKEQQSTFISPVQWNHENIEQYWMDEQFIGKIAQHYNNLLDTYVDQLIQSSDRLISFTLYYTSKLFTYEIIRRIKAKAQQKIILCGGPLCFPTSDGKNVLTHCRDIDGICYGEAESLLVPIINHVFAEGTLPEIPGLAIRKKEKIYDYGEQIERPSLNEIPFADFSTIDRQQYTPRILPMYMSRSCINNCRYCNEKASWGKYRFRPPQRVVDDIVFQQQAFSGYEYMFFTDSLLNASIDHLVALCDELIRKNIPLYWGCQCAIRKEMTSAVFEKMASARCNSITLGLESGSNKVLRLMGKNYSTTEAEEMFAKAHAVGMSIHANIIVGYPGESKVDFLETVYFVCKMKMKYSATFAVLICCITVGSYLHQHLSDLNIILPKDWLWHTKDNRNNIAIRRSRQHFLTECLNSITNTTPQQQLLILLGKYVCKKERLEISSSSPSGVLLSH